MAAVTWFSEPDILEARLDAEFYMPRYLELVAQLISTGTAKRLAQIEADGSYGVLPDTSHYGQGPIPLLRGGDLAGIPLHIPPAGVPHVPDRYFAAKRGRLEPGHVLLLIKGASIGSPKSVAVVSETWSQRSIVNGSVYKFAVTPPHDPFYVCAFFGTRWGTEQKTRAIANTGINYNDQEAIRAFVVALPDPAVQKAIGNKLRVAGMMMHRGARRLNEARDVLRNLFPAPADRVDVPGQFTALNQEESAWRLDSRVLLSSRLDSSYYAPNYLRDAKELEASGMRVARFDSFCSRLNCGATPKHVEYGSTGAALIRTGDVLPDFFNEKSVARVPGLSVEADAATSVVPGDIVYTMSGSIGNAAVYPPGLAPATCSNTIARARVVDPEQYDPDYIALFLNSRLGRSQSERLVSGGVLGHVMPTAVKGLRIPLPEATVQQQLGGLVRESTDLRRRAHELVESARADVDAVVDGTLEEAVLLQQDQENRLWLAASGESDGGAW